MVVAEVLAAKAVETIIQSKTLGLRPVAEVLAAKAVETSLMDWFCRLAR